MVAMSPDHTAAQVASPEQGPQPAAGGAEGGAAEEMEGAPAAPLPLPRIPVCPVSGSDASRATRGTVEKTDQGEDSEAALQGEFSWTIEGMNKLKQQKLYSPVFQSGQYNWCGAA